MRYRTSWGTIAGLMCVMAVVAMMIGVVSADETGVASHAADNAARSQMAAPMRKAPYLVYGGDNTEMAVHWQLLLSDTCTLEWGTDPTYSLGSVETVEYGSDHQHSYTVGDLVPGAQYYYRVVVEGQEYDGYFRAAPADDAYSVKFFAYGDTRTYPADHDAVAGAMVSAYTADPDLCTFVLSVGDLVSNGDNESTWDTEFFDPAYSNISGMLAHLPYQSARGNHEGAAILFAKYFPYPFVGGRYWSFDYGPAHFTVVDQYTSYGTGSAQLAWIESDLSSTTKPWKFICLHEPGWSAGGHSNSTGVQNYIQPLCEQYGVPIVFGGHNHYYARAVVNGIQHVTTGGGGAPLYDPNPAYPNIVTTAKAHHLCIVDIDGGTLHYKAITPTGTLLDSLTLSLPEADVNPGSGVPGHLPELGPADPNPFKASTVLTFSIPEPSQVTLAVYDTGGRRVRTLVDHVFGPGSSRVEWDGADDAGRQLPSGVYFCRLQTGDRRLTLKLVRMK